MKTQNGLTLWNENGWRPLGELRREMDRLFDDFWPASAKTDSQFVPACDVEEEPGHYLLTLEMPGIAKDDLKVEVLENQLIVSGERHHEQKDRADVTWYSERRFGKFQRIFSLPAGMDANRIEASYQDGVLRLMVPKAEFAKPRQVKITSGGTGFFSKLLGSKNESKNEPKSDKDEHHSGPNHKEKVA